MRPLTSRPSLAHNIVKSTVTITSPPIIVLHGLLGSSKNFQGWTKLLSAKIGKDRDIFAMDLRNHGHSSSQGMFPDMSYHAMAEDVAETLNNLGISTCHVIGHSMGGKVAACMADQSLRAKINLLSLTMLDISPTPYSNEDLSLVVDCIQKLRFITNQWHSLSKPDLQKLVFTVFSDRPFAMFIMSNILRSTSSDNGSQWQWAFHLDAIETNLDSILSFPEIDTSDIANNLPMMVLKGAESKFVKSSHMAAIKEKFPLFTTASIRGATHGLHVEKPEETTDKVAEFIGLATKFHNDRASVSHFIPEELRQSIILTAKNSTSADFVSLRM